MNHVIDFSLFFLWWADPKPVITGDMGQYYYLVAAKHFTGSQK